MEGVAKTLIHIIKKEIKSDPVSMLGGLLAKPAFNRVKKDMDYSEVGGAPLLGVQGAVVKGHGSSNGHAVCCAIKQCIKIIEGHVPELIEQGLQSMLPEEEA